MEITKMYMFVSMVLATLLCMAECQYFNLNPQSVTVTEGSNVTFTCGTAYLFGSGYVTACTSFSFSWNRRKTPDSPVEEIARCQHVSANFIGRVVVVLVGERYHLHIQNVQLEDTGSYWCMIHRIDRPSEKALLTVNPLLPEYEPSCDIDSKRPRVGSTISFKCTLSDRDPLSLLTWFESTSSGSKQIEDKTEVNPGETYTVERVLTESDNMREFTCVAGPHPDGPCCSITPLQIPTTVSISPSQLMLHEHENATFTCDLKSTPQQIADEYRWRIFQVDKLDAIKIKWGTVRRLDGWFELAQNGQTLLIINITAQQFNNSQIRCIAFQDSTPITCLNDSLLFVLPSSPESSDKPHLVPTMVSSPTPCYVSVISSEEKSGQWSRTAVIIGGAVEGLVFMVTAAALVGCYVVKNKRQREEPRRQGSDSRVKPTADRHHRCSVAMTELPNSLTYTELTRNDGETSEPSPYQNLRSDAQKGHETIYSNVP